MDHDMTLDARTSRLIRTWLHETADELPDDPALFAGIKAGLRTPRPRPWAWPFRPGTLRTVSVSLVATLVIVLVGLAFRSPSPDGRAPAVGAAPSTSPIPTPLPDGSMPPGRYTFSDALGDGYEVTLDVPAGWSADHGLLLTRDDGDPPNGATVEVAQIWRIQVDPCHRSGDDLYVQSDDPSLESIAAVLASWGAYTGRRTPSSPTTTEATFGTFDGRPGVEVTVLAPDNVVIDTCTDGRYVLWESLFTERWIQGASEAMRVRVVQVGSRFLFLAAGSFPGTPADVLAEQQAMLDSVRIVSRPVPPSAQASPTP